MSARHAAAGSSPAKPRRRVAGDTVIAGQTLAVIEAMKMEMRVTAGAAGTVTSVRVLSGTQVEAGAILMELDIEDAPCLPTTKPS